MELKDKVVVITGGSKGFGRALAEAFIKEGAKVAICALNEEELSKTAQEIGALCVVADVRNEADMQKLADETIKKYGGLDIWINNAGIWLPHANIENCNMEEVQEMFDINVIGLINGSRVALKHMKEKNSGVLLNILSGAGLEPKPEIAAYAATKWAGNGFTKSIREENKNTKVKILSFYPGGMKTTIFKDYKYPDFDKFLDPAKVAEKVINNLKQETPNMELIIRRVDLQ